MNTTAPPASAAFPAIAFSTTRFPPFWLASAIYGSFAIWAFWTWAELPDWTLSGAYAATAVVGWFALFGARRYGRFDPIRDSTIHAIHAGFAQSFAEAEYAEQKRLFFELADRISKPSPQSPR